MADLAPPSVSAGGFSAVFGAGVAALVGHSGLHPAVADPAVVGLVGAIGTALGAAVAGSWAYLTEHARLRRAAKLARLRRELASDGISEPLTSPMAADPAQLALEQPR